MKVKAINIIIVVVALIIATLIIVPLIPYKKGKYINITTTKDGETHLESYSIANKTGFGKYMLKYWATILTKKGKLEDKSITTDDTF